MGRFSDSGASGQVMMSSERDLLFGNPDKLRRLLRRLDCTKQRAALVALGAAGIILLCFGIVSLQERHVYNEHDQGMDSRASATGDASRAGAAGRRPNTAGSFPFVRGGEISGVDPLAGAYPLARGVCGADWPMEFAKLQAKALQQGTGGLPAPRFSVLSARRGDLAQRLAAAVTAALHALVTGRAFEVEWFGNHYLWEALSSHYIDWRYTLPGSEKATRQGTLLLDVLNDSNATNALVQSDISRIGENYDTVVWARRYGATTRLASENVPLGGHLHSLGLRPETAFACLFDFLFRPTPAAVALFPGELKDLLDPEAVHITIEITTAAPGGAAAVPESLAPYASYFDCAMELEKQLALPGQRVTWLLVTDSFVVRRLAHAKYGDKLLASASGSVPLRLEEDVMQDMALAASAMELWLMSLADAHVITDQSAAGRLASALSMRWQRTFIIPPPAPATGAHAARSCQLGRADSYTAVTSGWTGI